MLYYFYCTHITLKVNRNHKTWQKMFAIIYKELIINELVIQKYIIALFIFV